MRSRGLLVGVVAVAVLAAGCGDGSDDATEEVSTVTLDLLDGAEAAGTSRIALAFDGEQAGFGETLHTTMELEGVIDFEAREHDLAGETEMRTVLPEGSVDEPAPPLRATLAMRRVDGTSYHRWASDGEEDVPWNRLDEEVEVSMGDAPTETTVVEGDDEVVVEGDAGSVAVEEDEVVVEDLPDEEADGDRSALDALFSLDGDLDPAAALDQIQDVATTFTVVGREDVRGEPTTHHRAGIDAEDLPLVAHGTDVEQVVDVWVDDDGRLRQLELGPARLELWDFGAEVAIEEPGPVAGPDGPDTGWGPFSAPVESGDWALHAAGDVDGRRWEVWAAPHEDRGETLVCRTLEVTPSGDAGPLEGVLDMAVEGVPHHDGAMAACGYGSALFSLPTPRPSVQVIVAQDWTAPQALPLVALVVDERWRDGSITIARDGAPDVEVTPDASGVAIWSPDVPAPPTEIRLAGGEVRCDVLTMQEQIATVTEAAPDELEGAMEEGGWGEGFEGFFPPAVQISGCVRA